MALSAHSKVSGQTGPNPSENIIVEEPGPGVEPYYTPSAVLQEKGDSAKLLDVTRASPKQLKTIDGIRVHKGDIVITRSGTIGRVAIITDRLDRAIVSDDLIRVRIKDDFARYYVFSYLQSPYALDQMLRNEYGAVQQHLEPNHVADILIPVPDDWDLVKDKVEHTKKLVATKEELERLTADSQESTEALIEGLVDSPIGTSASDGTA